MVPTSMELNSELIKYKTSDDLNLINYHAKSAKNIVLYILQVENSKTVHIQKVTALCLFMLKHRQ